MLGHSRARIGAFLPIRFFNARSHARGNCVARTLLATVLPFTCACAAFGQTCTVSQTNTSHPSIAPNFYVNDNFTFTVTGPPNGQIYVTETMDGVVTANNVEVSGWTLNSSGVFTTNLTQTAGIGFYTEYWYVNEIPCDPTAIEFSIFPTPDSPTLSATPNPIVVTDGSGEGTATLTFDAPGHTSVKINAGSTLLCNTTVPGTCTTGKWVTNGMVFTMYDASTNAQLATLTATVTTDPITLTIIPNPIIVTDGTGNGTATLSYSAPTHPGVKIYIGSSLLCTGPPSGSCSAGKYVSNGSVFTMYDSSTNAQLATATAQVTAPTLVLTLSPNPILIASGSSGSTTVNYTTPTNLPGIGIYMGSTTVCTPSPGTGTCNASLVTDGAVFYLKNTSTNAVLATAVASVITGPSCAN